MGWSFFKRNELTPVVREIKKGISSIVKKYAMEDFWIDQKGVYDVNPKYLSFCVCVKSDREKERLKNNQLLGAEINQLLVESPYPKDYVNSIEISFESQETVDRESGGNWHNHFQ